MLIHCRDFLSSPFSPDPPGETIALLRSETVRCVCRNGGPYLMDWGTPRWAAGCGSTRSSSWPATAPPARCRHSPAQSAALTPPRHRGRLQLNVLNRIIY